MPTAGKLLENLKAEGLAPGDIETVVLSHGHPDHIGGNTDANGEPIFPNARHVMLKDEVAEDLAHLPARGPILGPSITCRSWTFSRAGWRYASGDAQKVAGGRSGVAGDSVSSDSVSR